MRWSPHRTTCRSRAARTWRRLQGEQAGGHTRWCKNVQGLGRPAGRGGAHEAGSAAAGKAHRRRRAWGPSGTPQRRKRGQSGETTHDRAAAGGGSRHCRCTLACGHALTSTSPMQIMVPWPWRGFFKAGKAIMIEHRHGAAAGIAGAPRHAATRCTAAAAAPEAAHQPCPRPCRPSWVPARGPGAWAPSRSPAQGEGGRPSAAGQGSAAGPPRADRWARRAAPLPPSRAPCLDPRTGCAPCSASHLHHAVKVLRVACARPCRRMAAFPQESALKQARGWGSSAWPSASWQGARGCSASRAAGCRRRTLERVVLPAGKHAGVVDEARHPHARQLVGQGLVAGGGAAGR